MKIQEMKHKNEEQSIKGQNKYKYNWRFRKEKTEKNVISNG